jgi:hypothetical protein
MGGQVFIPKQTAEEIASKQREEAEQAAQWRKQTLLGHVLSGGSSTGRIINWANMPSHAKSRNITEGRLQ